MNLDRLKDDQGAALIAVIWVVFLLSLLAVGVLSVTLSARQSTTVFEENVSSQMLAKSAVRIFLKQKFYSAEEKAIFNANIVELDPQVSVEVEFEGGKFNLNRADAARLSALFASKGKPEAQARALAAAVIDWRDSDDEVSPGGAEADQYSDAGRNYGPRNGPFEALAELNYVLGFDSDFYHCVRPLLTVTADYDSSVVNIPFAKQDVRDVFLWAYENDWEGRNWPDPATIAQYVDIVEIEPNELSGQTLTLNLTVASEVPAQFSMQVRYLTRGEYAQLTGLRTKVVEDSSRYCP